MILQMINEREKAILKQDIADAEELVSKRVAPLIAEKKKIIKGLPKKLQVGEKRIIRLAGI